MERVRVNRCECGCGAIVKNRFVYGHNRRGIPRSERVKLMISAANKGNNHTAEARAKMSIAATGRKVSDEAKAKMSISRTGNTYRKSYRTSEETKMKLSIANMKCNPNSKYGEEWLDKEYKDDCRKDACERCGRSKEDHFAKYKRAFDLHHRDLDGKNNHPDNLETLCVSCHKVLHWEIEKENGNA